MGTLTAYPSQVRADATCLLVYNGLPNKSVAWVLTGSGSIASLALATDSTGRAAAIYTPGTEGDTITIEVVSGA